MFAGRRPVRWVWQFVERCLHHPQSVTHAKNLGGEKHWVEWLHWTPTAAKTAELAQYFLNANGGKGEVHTPGRSESTSEPQDLDSAFVALMSMQ